MATSGDDVVDIIPTAWTDSWTDTTDEVADVTPPAAKKNSMVMVYAQVLLAPVIFLGNIMILVAIRRSKSMKKVTYLFLGHLAVADLLFGVGMCMRFFLIITKNSEKYPCMFTQCFVITAGGASMTGILYLCLEGYLSVKYFMSFKRVFTTNVAWALIAACWIFWIAMSLMSVIIAVYSPVKKAACFLGGGYYETWYVMLIPTIYFSHLLLVVYYQLGTIIITRKRFSNIKPMGSERNGLPGQDLGQQRRLARLANLSKLVGLVLTVFFVCWSPAMGGLYFFATCKKNCTDLGKMTVNLASLFLISSIMNVVIYGIKSPEFRRGFHRMLCRPFSRVGPLPDNDISKTAKSSTPLSTPARARPLFKPAPCGPTLTPNVRLISVLPLNPDASASTMPSVETVVTATP